MKSFFVNVSKYVMVVMVKVVCVVVNGEIMILIVVILFIGFFGVGKIILLCYIFNE